MMNGKLTLSQTFDSSFRFIDGVLSLNNSRFGAYLYPNELEVKDVTDTHRLASYLDRHLEIDNGRRLKQTRTTSMLSIKNTSI
jgi:hypothetical protein